MKIRGHPESIPATGERVASVEDLHLAYVSRGRRLDALRGVSLELRAREIVCLVGESGSGKSSLAMALLGLLGSGQSTIELSGEVFVLGVDMARATDEERRRLRRERVGAVFQDPMSSLNPTMTIGKQLMEVAGSSENAVELLDAVGVPEARLRLRSYPHELSGGQRQRVMIAMAIARDPALVVADEPTTALDVTIQAQILALIRELRDRVGCAFLVVTHDLGVAAQIADRIAVCYAGRIVESGEAATVLREPSHPYTAALLRSRITLGADRRHLLATLPGAPPDLHQTIAQCQFAPRCAFSRPACRAAEPDLILVVGSEQASACIRVEELRGELGHGRLATDLRPEPSQQSGGVEINSLRKTFVLRTRGWTRTQLTAVHDVGLTIAPGECVALVGESGCGKSTLLRMVAGLIPRDAGAIDLGSAGRPQMVFQDAGASLTPWLTVGEQIGDRLRSAKITAAEAKQRVTAALTQVGLSPELARRKPSQLSGGQRQRVAFARTIVVPPSVLLCDEPTSSLDASLAATVLNLILRLRQELGMAVIFVTHDLAAARFVADRIAVMYLGRVVEIGTAEDLVASPAHPYTRALLDAVPDLGRREPNVAGELPSPMQPPSGCPYHPRCPVRIDQCSRVMPTMRSAGDAHLAACVHVGDEGMSREERA